jgi:hypothetical protein
MFVESNDPGASLLKKSLADYARRCGPEAAFAVVVDTLGSQGHFPPLPAGYYELLLLRTESLTVTKIAFFLNAESPPPSDG